MKVLSNLMGNDTKISANCIAIKDNNNSANALDNYLKSMDKYSTTEVKTNKVWIDGKPIYRKVFNTTTPSTAGSQALIVPLSNNIDNVVNLDGMLTQSLARFPLNAWYSSTYYIATYYNPDDGIMCLVGSSLASRTCVVIVEYTKTTD